MFNKTISQLPVSFVGKGEVKGFKFTQVKKTKISYLYKVESLNATYFDVFKIQIDTRFDKEFYPKSNKWGYSAWTFNDYNKANRKFQELNAQ